MAGLADDRGEARVAEADDATALEASSSRTTVASCDSPGSSAGTSPFAEDVVQTALERAWRSRRSINDAARLRPWHGSRAKPRVTKTRALCRLASVRHSTRPTSCGSRLPRCGIRPPAGAR